MNLDFLSDLIINKVDFVSTMHNKEGASSIRTNRQRWAIILKYEGETEYFSKGTKYKSNVENIAILPKGSSYKWKCTKEGAFSTVEFQSDLSLDKIITVPIKNSEQILEKLKKMEVKASRKDDFYRTESLSDIYSLIYSILQFNAKKYMPTEKQKKIAPVLDFIAENYTAKIKNEELAAITGYSTVYFRQLFTEVTGMPPIEYITQYKIRKAKEMLKSDHTSVSDIAESLGYQNIYDFSRSFKKYVGVSPIIYKKERS